LNISDLRKPTVIPDIPLPLIVTLPEIDPASFELLEESAVWAAEDTDNRIITASVVTPVRNLEELIRVSPLEGLRSVPNHNAAKRNSQQEMEEQLIF
jgi:hypothetical protein